METVDLSEPDSGGGADGAAGLRWEALPELLVARFKRTSFPRRVRTV